jgi:hypothetical protein
MAKMGGFRSPKGVKQPKMPPMGGSGKVSGMPVGGMNTSPNMGFKKGGAVKKRGKK